MHKQQNPRTLSRHITAIKQWHRYQNFSDPAQSPIVAKTLTGISRVHGKPKNKAAPLLSEHLIKIVQYYSRTIVESMSDVSPMKYQMHENHENQCRSEIFLLSSLWKLDSDIAK